MTAGPDVQIAFEAINDLDVDAIAALPLDCALTAYSMLEDARRILAQVCSQLPNLIAPNMGEKQVTVEGVGTFVMHGKKNRTQWEKDALLSAVLDSRLIDPKTGEVADETPLAKVLHVYNLPAPRTTALKARAIDADQFCRSEWAGYSIEVLA